MFFSSNLNLHNLISIDPREALQLEDSLKMGLRLILPIYFGHTGLN